MYFWKINALKEDIKAGKLTEKSRFVYALIYIVLTEMAMEAAIFVTPIVDVNMWDVASSVLYVLIVCVGVTYAYIANGGKEGSDFLGKYFAISFVIAIRFMVFLSPLLAVAVAYNMNTADAYEEMPTTVVDLLVTCAFMVLYYWRVCHHIRQVANTNEQEEAYIKE